MSCELSHELKFIIIPQIHLCLMWVIFFSRSCHHNGFYQVSLYMQACLHPVTSDQRYERIRSYRRRDRQPPKMKRLCLEPQDCVKMGGPELYPVSDRQQSQPQKTREAQSTPRKEKAFRSLLVFGDVFIICWTF